MTSTEAMRIAKHLTGSVKTITSNVDSRSYGFYYAVQEKAFMKSNPASYREALSQRRMHVNRLFLLIINGNREDWMSLEFKRN